LQKDSIFYNKGYISFQLAIAVVLLGFIPSLLKAQKIVPVSPPVFIGKDKKMSYTPDSLGNRIPDFSYSGYMAGEKAIPLAPVKVIVPVKSGDATRRIQAALDYVTTLPLDQNGIRGAVLLASGTHEVYGSLKIKNSGVVLRGSGTSKNGTVLIAAGENRETFIRVAGADNRVFEKAIQVKNTYVPVNAMQFEVESTAGFKQGDLIQIHRPSTEEWINVLGTSVFGGGLGYIGWKPGQRDLYWNRVIKAIKGNTLIFDAPITTSLDKKYGQATVRKYSWTKRISNSGVENISLESAYNKENNKDEDHRWVAISIENAQDSWVRQVNFKHFAGSAVFVQQTAKRVTVEDCKSLEPISEIGRERRYTFYTKGQQTLFQRLYSEFGYHDFATGFMAAGPNAFVQCQSVLPFSFSGSVDSWASGVLFDIVNIDGNNLSFMNRWQDGQGAGWTAANSVFWQCTASRIDNHRPPTAQNWAFGNWAQFAGDGYWDMSNEHISPRSLYYAQLKDRLGKEVEARTFLMPVESEASSSPSIETAAELTLLAANPAPLLANFIDEAKNRTPIDIAAEKGVKTIDQLGVKSVESIVNQPIMEVKNSWLVRGEKVVTGNKQNVQWWSGSSRPYWLEKARPHITRYVPGETGTGLTDDLDSVTDAMVKKNILAMDHNYGLWYDRRRDDHQRIRRADGEVWPPFYEQPFARSGQGTAWDGLSKYDLTKYNKFYWGRLKQFADLADEKGLVLIHQNYFQHNILEAGAHYADFPWRPANNINNTGFPEPVPYAGDKRLFMAEQFYDVQHPVRRELHRAYIRQCLDNFKDNSGVIQLISEEYTGPLHFVAFWIDVIREWEKETGKNALIGLSTTKDVQDAILKDKARAAAVDLIDIRYWYPKENGEYYEPKGGQNLAPRQHARKMKGGKTSFEQVYKAVKAYRENNPGKAVMYSAQSYDSLGWAVFMAGGSMANLPKINYPEFYTQASKMQSVSVAVEGKWVLSGENAYIVYSTSKDPLALQLGSGNFNVRYINPSNGALLKEEKLKGGKSVSVKQQGNGAEIIWITKK